MKSNRSTWIAAGLLLTVGLVLPSLIALRPDGGSVVPASPSTGAASSAGTAGTPMKVRRQGEKVLRQAAAPRDEEWDAHERWVLRCTQWAEGRLPDPSDADAFRSRTAGAPEEALAWISSQGPTDRRHDLLAVFCAEWGGRDFPAAWQWAVTRPDDREALAVIAGLAARGELRPEVVEWLYELPASRTLRISLAMRLLERIAEPELFHAMALSLEPYERHSWTPIALKAWAAEDPLSALAEARTLQDRDERNGGVATVLGTWPAEKLTMLQQMIPSFHEQAWVSMANEILAAAGTGPPPPDSEELETPRRPRPICPDDTHGR